MRIKNTQCYGECQQLRNSLRKIQRPKKKKVDPKQRKKYQERIMSLESNEELKIVHTI